MIKTAELSGCERYRWHLRREWEPSRGYCAFVMLNPSTADGNQDDPTIRRCIEWATLIGCGALEVVNLYAYRATDPRDLTAAHRGGLDIIGQENDEWLLLTCNNAAVVIAAWGAHPLAIERGQSVKSLLYSNGNELFCLGLATGGAPKHPLARGRHRVDVKVENVRRFS